MAVGINAPSKRSEGMADQQVLQNLRNRAVLTFYLLLTVSLLNGCATIYTQMNYVSGGAMEFEQPNMIYSGTRWDIDNIKYYAWGPTKPWYSVIVAAIVDLPFSII